MPKVKGNTSPAAASSKSSVALLSSSTAISPLVSSLSPRLDGSGVAARLPLWNAMTSEEIESALEQQQAWRKIQSAVRAHVLRWRRSPKKPTHIPPADRPRKKRRRTTEASSDSQSHGKMDHQVEQSYLQNSFSLLPAETSRLSSTTCRFRSPPLLLALTSPLPAERLLVGRRLLEEAPRDLLQLELKYLLTQFHQGRPNLLSPSVPRWLVPQITFEWTSLLLQSVESNKPTHINTDGAHESNADIEASPVYSDASALGILNCSLDDVVQWTRILHDRDEAPDFGTVGLMALLQHVLLQRHCTSEMELRIAQFRHEHWLWNAKLFRTLSQDDAREAIDLQHPQDESMSPLSCLLRTYFHLQSHDVSFNQVALQKSREILQRLLDPRLMPCLKRSKGDSPERRATKNLRVKSSMKTGTAHLRNDLMDVLLEYADPADVPELFGAMMEEAEHGDLVVDADEESSFNDGADDKIVLESGEQKRSNSAVVNGELNASEQSDDHILEFSSDDDSAHEEAERSHLKDDDDDGEEIEEDTSDGGDAFEDEHMSSDGEDDDQEMFSGTSSPSHIMNTSRSRRSTNEPVDENANQETCTAASIERVQMVVAGCMEVLSTLYPMRIQGEPKSIHHFSRRHDYLSLSSEHALMECINKQIEPPSKPDTTKIILRRAPTQEEFFQRSLSRNPIQFSELKPRSADQTYEPTIADLRQYIADDLHMSESAELIEILVAKRILGLHLKLRVVHQVLWRQHVLESTSASSTSGSTLFSAGGLSMLFSSGRLEERLLTNRVGNVDSNTPLNELPSMIVTYRLAGVDGEATEDTVNYLADPETSPELISETEKRMEQVYGLTRLVTFGRGIHVLVQSVKHTIGDSLHRVYADAGKQTSKLRNEFQADAPCAGLLLLRHCCQLPDNRKLLVKARAPTVLLTLLLDILRGIEEDHSNGKGLGNPTTDLLQELIERLTSDISDAGSNYMGGAHAAKVDCSSVDESEDAISMTLLLESVETITLSLGLRQIVGKLLPLLTYGQEALSRTLAEHFDRNIVGERLGEYEASMNESGMDASLALMETFVQSAKCLPSTDVCNPLRAELIKCGFIQRMTAFIMTDLPTSPPPWSLALWDGDTLCFEDAETKAVSVRVILQEKWRAFYVRPGLRTAFSILIGLCKEHAPTQSSLAEALKFVDACHWMESTSDNAVSGISTGGLGLQAETLLDEMIESNRQVRSIVDGFRSKTRLRKRELAEQKRKHTLKKMSSSFGTLRESNVADEDKNQSIVEIGARISVTGPFQSLFREKSSKTHASGSSHSAAVTKNALVAFETNSKNAKPTWLSEMENLKEDAGLRCVVCHEGNLLQPSELLGLYVHVKRVSITSDHGGLRQSIDGTDLLRSLPTNMPNNLVGDSIVEDWYSVGRAAAEIKSSSCATSYMSSSRKTMVYATSVSAGNAIHFSCHQAARQADQNHAKAPKSEWEGATLRNNRVATNSILPIISSQSTSVSPRDIDSALKTHQVIVNRIIGSSPKSMLWNTLHDLRWLLLRMAYGETLSTDCGGGSLASNCLLLFYQLVMVEAFDKRAESDELQHARALPCGFLAAVSWFTSTDDETGSNLSVRGVADAAPMASLACIALHNNPSDIAVRSHGSKMLWHLGRDYFLRGLIICAGRRQALGLDNSGCLSGRGLKRARSHSFAEWDNKEPDDRSSSPEISSSIRRSKSASRRPKTNIADFQNALRPMITLFAIFDQLSVDFVSGMTGTAVEEAALRLVTVIESCQKSKNINELIEKAKVAFEPDEMIEWLQKGMVVA